MEAATKRGLNLAAAKYRGQRIAIDEHFGCSQ